MLAKRIIPCLDVKDGNVVKGVHFENLQEAGDPVDHASFYSNEGADELVFLDISATIEGRATMVDVVRRVAEVVFIPLTVGGGIRTVADMENLLKHGADKISINSAAIRTPGLIGEGARKFGSQCIVVALDGKRTGDGWKVHIDSGRTSTGRDAVAWAREAADRGAGEILLTSIDRDGTQKGYDISFTAEVAAAVGIPVIASGGAGTLDHLFQVVGEGRASAVLLASLLHYRQVTIADIKQFLQEKGVPIRP